MLCFFIGPGIVFFSLVSDPDSDLLDSQIRIWVFSIVRSGFGSSRMSDPDLVFSCGSDPDLVFALGSTFLNCLNLSELGLNRTNAPQKIFRQFHLELID